jgi:hypothetical protein
MVVETGALLSSGFAALACLPTLRRSKSARRSSLARFQKQRRAVIVLIPQKAVILPSTPCSINHHRPLHIRQTKNQKLTHKKKKRREVFSRFQIAKTLQTSIDRAPSSLPIRAKPKGSLCLCGCTTNRHEKGKRHAERDRRLPLFRREAAAAAAGARARRERESPLLSNPHSKNKTNNNAIMMATNATPTQQHAAAALRDEYRRPLQQLLRKAGLLGVLEPAAFAELLDHAAACDGRPDELEPVLDALLAGEERERGLSLGSIGGVKTK